MSKDKTAEFIFNFPVVKYANRNTFAEQMQHLISEIAEVATAPGVPETAVELLDVIHSAETALRILVSSSGVPIDLDDLRDHVIAKNRARDYYYQ